MRTETETFRELLPMITAEAVRMARKYANLPSMNVQDVRQEMSLEVVKSLRTYDPGKASISTHAYNAIRTARKTIRHQLKEYTGETRETIHGSAPKVCPECGTKLHYGNCECGYSAAPNAVQISFECQAPKIGGDLGMNVGNMGMCCMNTEYRSYVDSAQDFYGWGRKRSQSNLSMDAEYRLFSASESWEQDEQQLLHALYTGETNFQDSVCRPYTESVQNYYGWSRKRAQSALTRLRSNCAEVLGC